MDPGSFFDFWLYFKKLTTLFRRIIQSGISIFHNYLKRPTSFLSELVIGKIRENLMKMVELPPSGPLAPPPGRTQTFSCAYTL